MSLWKIDSPPLWAPNAVATPKGWVDPNTGEVLVAIRGLSTVKELHGGANLLSIKLDKTVYKLADVVNVSVHYTEPVTVSGTPQVTLSVNGVSRTANYASGSGTTTLVFQYTIQSTDVAAAGQLSLTSPIGLNSGTMKDTDNNTKNAVLVFTNKVDAKVATTVVDGAVPTISSVTMTNAHYNTGQAINLTVNWSEAVTVNTTGGVPTLPLHINATNRNATYVSGSGTNALVFSYTVVGGDVCTNGQFTTGTTLALNSGTIKDAVGNAATLTFVAPTTSTTAVN